MAPNSSYAFMAPKSTKLFGPLRVSGNAKNKVFRGGGTQKGMKERKKERKEKTEGSEEWLSGAIALGSLMGCTPPKLCNTPPYRYVLYWSTWTDVVVGLQASQVEDNLCCGLKAARSAMLYCRVARCSKLI
jgi:hypothetical protein